MFYKTQPSPPRIHDTVTLWITDGRPVRMVLRSTRYRVIGKPEPITEEWWSPMITHPYTKTIGWRLAIHPDDQPDRVMRVDVLRDDDQWILASVYD